MIDRNYIQIMREGTRELLLRSLERRLHHFLQTRMAFHRDRIAVQRQVDDRVGGHLITAIDDLLGFTDWLDSGS